jgi:hypothetical protein
LVEWVADLFSANHNVRRRVSDADGGRSRGDGDETGVTA